MWFLWDSVEFYKNEEVLMTIYRQKWIKEHSFDKSNLKKFQAFWHIHNFVIIPGIDKRKNEW